MRKLYLLRVQSLKQDSVKYQVALHDKNMPAGLNSLVSEQHAVTDWAAFVDYPE